MKLFLGPNASVHAPACSTAALISAFTAGADGALIPVQETRDGQLVVAGQAELSQTTNSTARIQDTDFLELRKLNAGLKFKDWQGQPVRYVSEFNSLRTALRTLPKELNCAILVLQGAESGTRAAFLAKLASLPREELRDVLFLVSSSADFVAIRQLDAGAAIAIDRATFEADEAFPRRNQVEAVWAEADSVFNGAALSAFGSKLEALQKEGRLRGGAILLPGGAAPTSALIANALAHPVVSTLCANSFAALPRSFRRKHSFVDETFRGRDVNTEMWSFGYARVSNDCHVFQDAGVHIDIKPYVASPQQPPANEVERRVLRLEGLMNLALRRSFTYVGGGVGLMHRITGDFEAQADVTSERAVQSTMVELSVVNVNPGRHLPSWNQDGTPRYPRDDHEKHAFFDPHGAPPFVGSEHDENDGFRTNSHFGSEYADNNYGSDAGDGTVLDVSLRIERRGPYFSTYVRRQGSTEERDWICTGVVRNDSMNAGIFLRCVGKRWQKADPQNPGGYLPVVPNKFLVSRVIVNCFD